MVEFTKEDEERYAQRLKERAERQEREAAAAAKKTQPEKPKPVKTGDAPFKSRIGKGFAKVLSKTADTAENIRSKADYVGNQTGRIKKAVIPVSKPKHKKTAAAKSFSYRPVKTRNRPAFRMQTRPASSRGSGMDDLIYGSHGQQSHGADDFMDNLINGKKGKRRDDFFRGLI